MKRHKDLTFTDKKFIIFPNITFKFDPFIANTPIVFVHTSKTGGTSIDFLVKYISSFHSFSYLEAYYHCPGFHSPNFFPEGCLGGIHLMKNSPKTYTMNDKPSVQFLLGHIPLPTNDYFKKEFQPISIIREPVDRLISLGNFLFQRKHLADSKIVNYITSVELDNLQTRALAGEEYFKGPCNEDVYQKAIHNIKSKFAIVAPTEEVDSVMAIIANYFKIDNLAYTRAQITGIKFISKDNYDLYQKLSARNSYDKKLYEYVTEYWKDWKNSHIENITENININTNYTVLSSSYYSSKKVEYMNLTQMQSCNIHEQDDLVGLTQYYK